MNRIEFMNQLEQLLVDIPAEEKQEALEFYTNYFEDAGVENEDQILRELGSPERVARTIKEDLSANGEYSKDGEYTEHGYKDANDSKDSIIKVEPSVTGQQTTEGNTEQSKSSFVNLNKETQNQNTDAQYEQQYQNNGYAQNQYGYEKPAKTNVGLLILVCIFAIPCIIPLTIAAFSTVFGLVIGFGAAGIGCTVAGVAVFLCGIVEVASVPAIGIVAIGGGLICFGLGILFFLLTTAIAKVIPAVCKAVGAIFRAPFGGRRVTA